MKIPEAVGIRIKSMSHACRLGVLFKKKIWEDLELKKSETCLGQLREDSASLKAEP